MATLGNALGAALGKVVASVVSQVGSTVTLLRRVPDASAPDGSTVEQWAPLVGGEGASVFLYALTEQRRRFAWGDFAGAAVEGLCATGAVPLRVGDGIEVTVGAFSGERFTIADVRPEPRGGMTQFVAARRVGEFPR